MSPSPPFPSPVPPSHLSSSSPHPGIIGEHRSVQQHNHLSSLQQQQHQEPPNGEYLLHLLQSGNHQVQHHNVVGNGGERGYEPQPHYNFSLPGIVPGNDIPMAAWDPAVAALGPSHSFNGLGSAGGERDIFPRLYNSQYNVSLGSGWPNQQQHAVGVAPLTSVSSPSSTTSSLSSHVDLRILQGRTGGHTLVSSPGVGVLPSSLYGGHVEMVPRRSTTPHEWQQQSPSSVASHQLRGMLTECDIFSNSSNVSPSNFSSSRASNSGERTPHQQFYGDGAELMKLLQISSSKPVGVGAADPLKVEKQQLMGLSIGGSCGVPQKVSPAIVHGPIGPPKRPETNRSSPADDILGRFWPAPAASISNGLQHPQDISSSINLKSLGFPYKEANSGSLPPSKDNRGWWGEPPPGDKKFEAFAAGESLAPHPSFGSSDGVGGRFALANRFYAFNKGGLSDNLEYHDGRGLLGGWSGELFDDGVGSGVTGPQFRKSQRPREDAQLYVKSMDTNLNLNSSNHHHDREHVESPSKESELDCPRDNGRASEGTRVVGGRRGSGSRSDAGRRGGRTVVGQWVAVNERQRERDGLDASGPSESAESGSDKGSNSAGTSCKEEALVVAKEGSGSQKARDDLKRRRGQQQEWRMKTPPAHAQTQAQAQSSSHAKSSEFSSGADSSEMINGNYRVSSPLKIRPLAAQVDHPGLPSSVVPDSASVPGSAVEDAKKIYHDRSNFHANGGSDNHDEGLAKEEEEELREAFAGYLDLMDEPDSHKQSFGLGPAQEEVDYETRHEREFRRHPHRTLAMPSLRPEMRYRPDLEKFTFQMLQMYQSLIPPEEEERKRRQFLSHLDQLVAREWPGARLFLFGSCANAFGVCNSDIDVCLSINDDQLSKADLVLKMAAILRSDNMQNVQALTHARVPIVKFTESTTGISCDICVNNMLAVVNSKLLHDYSQIDVRLRQLAFLVKHWAKRRQVNETYRGTLSSYAYVLMCIHFLQQRKPAILPCLQDMRPTYRVTVGNIECAYYDQIETLQSFGANNKETLGELLTSFFEYWAFRHDYTRAVISVRTGGYLSKDEKEWTRRIGNERHLICIEDPLEVAHDLGRVVDRHSIRVLRDEFHRAAKILRHDLNPCTTLFEPFVREK
ncbi:non-canonical poly(A) RNA polymerase PAPD5/7 [Marchantia polymorpha subsp. ruderalis]|uniref:RNA uridylyltransferase n=2 Tax=Marchantia polymorpha TaxID=3197 RepID=A0A176VSR3_MARPO|nr:hypothetical protein AXG93_1633s1070 [Marchantia polymorpha subsp. ruderalis]PTQ34554.1 hypothetical protein MARPO_0079s0057 [Marchantia polymorpha]BBN19998.1 hypothetical protein Mp_8g15550 [Marchantia polymorpha subsp. ruderalis]|eukprot:PTQ34554.1 hypothetical protein MARPO_0079s0057 [Marchantia polymorpha]